MTSWTGKNVSHLVAQYIPAAIVDNDFAIMTVAGRERGKSQGYAATENDLTRTLHDATSHLHAASFALCHCRRMTPSYHN